MPVAAPRMIHASIGLGLLMFITRPTGISTMQLEVKLFTEVLSARSVATGERFITVPTSRREIFTDTASFAFLGEECFLPSLCCRCKKENLRAAVFALVEASTAKSTSSDRADANFMVQCVLRVVCCAKSKDRFSKRGAVLCNLHRLEQAENIWAPRRLAALLDPGQSSRARKISDDFDGLVSFRIPIREPGNYFPTSKNERDQNLQPKFNPFHLQLPLRR
jgi:hypothetical protein